MATGPREIRLCTKRNPGAEAVVPNQRKPEYILKKYKQICSEEIKAGTRKNTLDFICLILPKWANWWKKAVEQRQDDRNRTHSCSFVLSAVKGPARQRTPFLPFSLCHSAKTDDQHEVNPPHLQQHNGWDPASLPWGAPGKPRQGNPQRWAEKEKKKIINSSVTHWGPQEDDLVACEACRLWPKREGK